MKTGILFNVEGNEKTNIHSKVHTIYVVDENDKLKNLSLRRLLLTESKIFIKEITN